MNKTLLSRTVQILLVLFLAPTILYLGRDFLVPIALAGLLAMLLLPLAGWLERRGLWRGIAALICVLVFVGAIAGIVAALTWQLSTVLEDFAQIKTEANEKLGQLERYISEHLGIPPEKQEEWIEGSQPTGAGGAVKMGAAVVGGFLNGLIDLILATVYIFMFLYFRRHFKNFLLKILPTTEGREGTRVIEEASHIAQKYLGGVGLMIMMLWVMYSIGFSIVGVKNPVFFAVLCGLLEIVPYVGNLTGTVVTSMMVLAQGGDAHVVLGVVITYGLVQFTQNNILTPLIVGAEVNINAVFTIMALLFGELVWGIPGMILAIPLLGIFKIVCDHVEPLQPIGFLLGPPASRKSRGGGWIGRIKGLFGKKQP